MNVSISVENFEYFLLILMRIASFMTIAPFFGHSNVPMRMKLGLAAAISLIVYGLSDVKTIEYTTIYGYTGLLILECVAGLLLGFSAYMCMSIISFSGRMIDMEIGLSMATLYDPTSRTQLSITGNMYNYFILLLLLVSNMHYFLLSAIIDSYKVIPVGGVQFGTSLYTTLVGFLSDYFIIGFRIILPVFAVTLIMNCVLGIMTRIAPQIHMFSVGIQLKLIAGLFVIFITIALIPNIATFIFDIMRQMVVSTMKGMY